MRPLSTDGAILIWVFCFTFQELYGVDMLHKYVWGKVSAFAPLYPG